MRTYVCLRCGAAWWVSEHTGLCPECLPAPAPTTRGPVQPPATPPVEERQPSPRAEDVPPLWWPPVALALVCLAARLVAELVWVLG